ncbi:MAG: YicC/YloC family endoribonuclease [Caldicoprobacter sp.]|uniref:YicC/YloC family endoribonuclease n=1 Tax=Caldicoprobacter sp. TaxID=2004500 RepID=UPI001DEC6659|nr:YicC family protein [Clostridia bacterium]
MIYSMTGFGRGKIEEQGREMSIEIKTLNHRFLDIYIKLPRTLSFLEEDIRSMIQQHVARGRVEVTVSYTCQQSDVVEVQVNRPLVEAYLACFNKLSQEYNLRNDLSISSLLTVPDVFVINEVEEDQEALRRMTKALMEQVLSQVKEMRRKEGENLKKDLLERIEKMESMLKCIEQRAPQVVEEYRQKLKNRLKDLLQGSELDENRFNMEVMYFAERCNITEEIVRLFSHFKQFRDALESVEPIGRRLDFLVQEMNREVNTIGSKANDLTIINLVVDIKSEIEKIREQVQNIE